MKNIFKSILAIVAGAALLSSCVQQAAEPLASSVSASSSEISLAAVNGSASLNITADGEWFINATNTDWVSFSPTAGEGNTTVYFTAEDNVDSYNEINGPRSGMVTVVGASGLAVVTVKQAGESGLDSKRTYSKVTAASDIELGKAYLLVANDGKALQAAKAFSASSESTYSYMYTDEVTDKDGVVTTPNANNGFVFVEKDGGFAIQEPNGRYLFQAASYNNFYSTTDLAKADVWTATEVGDGTFKIENQTVSGKYLQYSISYSSYGAYGGAQDNAAMPVLYKDSAAPSDEVLEVAESTTVSGSKTDASITVKSNKTWKVRCHDSWIKTFTAEGEGNGAIELTFDANTSYDAARTATLHIIGETTNFEVTFTQDHLYHILDVTIAEVIAAEDGDQQYRVTGAVSKVNGTPSSRYGTNFYVKDSTGEIYVYGSYNLDETAAMDVKVGNIVTLTGPKTSFNNNPQFKNATVESQIVPQDATVAEVLAADVASTYLESQYYKVTGIVKEIKSDTYGNLYLKEQDSDTYIYVYGITNAPVAKNDKSFGALGISEGDILTIVGQRGQFATSKVADQKEEMVNSFYISHQTPAPVSDNQIVLDCSTQPCEDFPNISAGETTTKTYTIGGYEWTFSPSSGAKFSWYENSGANYILWGKQGAYILMPCMSGKKLTKVTLLTGTSASTAVKVGVYAADGSAAVAGGEEILLSAQNAEFSYTLTGTEIDTQYQLRVCNDRNAQFQKLTLEFE